MVSGVLKHLSVLICLSFCAGESSSISTKGSKYASIVNRRRANDSVTTPLPTTTSTLPTTTQDPFFSDDNDIFAEFDDAFDGMQENYLQHLKS